MKNFLLFFYASLAEIIGCYCFWAWFRLDKSYLWLLPATISLLLFAFILALVESQYAGRAFAAYGGIYICSSILFMWLVENNPPDKFDICGGVICLIGVFIIINSHG